MSLEGTADNQVCLCFQHYTIQEGECIPLNEKGFPCYFISACSSNVLNTKLLYSL